MEWIDSLRQDRVPRRLDLGSATGVLLVGLDDRRHSVRDRLAGHLHLQRGLELSHPSLELPGDRSEMAVEGELMEVAQPRPVLVVCRAPGLTDAIDRLALEERFVSLVDRLDLQIGLVTGPLQVVLAVDLLEEALRVAPVLIEVPGHRLQR